MEQVIDLRPVYHRKEERIRARVILASWLALLLARIVGTPGSTWPNYAASTTASTSGPSPPRRHLPAAHEITKAQRDILRALKIDVPHPIYQLTPAAEP